MIKTIRNNKLVKNTAALASGSIIAQIIGVLCTPILTRYFSPDDFGVLGGVLTVAGILAVVISLKYEMAIVLSESISETKNLVQICLFTLFVFIIISFPIFYLFPEFLIWLGLKSASPLLITLMGVITIGTGLQNIFYQWHNKLENYFLLSKNRVVQSLTVVGIQLLSLVIVSDGLGLVWGYVFGVLLALPVLIFPLKNELSKLFTSAVELKSILKKHYRFPLYTAPQNLLNSVSQGLPILMLGKYFAAEQVGFYFFTVRILQLPSSIIGGSIRQVFYKRASDLRNDVSRLQKEFIKTTKGLLALIIIPLLIIFIFGPHIFRFVFGAEWEIAGEYAKWMFLWVGVGFVNPPAMVLFLVFDKQKNLFVYEVFLFLSRFLVLFYTSLQGDILFTIKSYSLVGLVCNLFIIFYAYHFIKKKQLR